MKPLLAATLERLDHLDQSKVYMVSPKLDGIRCLRVGGVCVSRNMKPIRNTFIQRCLRGLPDGLDGELIVGAPTGELVLNRSVSGVMSGDGEPDFKYHLFDNYLALGGFASRFGQLYKHQNYPKVTVVPHTPMVWRDIEQYERDRIEEGYEGIMIRGMHGHYKPGRSTHGEGLLWKFKRFRDGEALVVGIREGVTNNNLQFWNEVGSSQRSTHKELMVPNGLVGTILGKDLKTGEPMVISPGRMTHDMRKYYLEHPNQLIGREIKYKTFDYGTVDAPRFTTFQGFHHDL